MCSFGEEIKVTPLQLAGLMGAFANGGTLYYLQYPRSEDDRAEFEPRVKRRLPIQPWLPQLRAGMEAAVQYGTARVAATPSVGAQVLGKTGTCGENQAKLGWFASYGVLPNGKKLSVVVLLRGGRVFSGSKAAEIAAEVYKELGQREQLASRPDANTSSAR
jgi:cell division protein FtsI/penicillin-binding protein 2